MARTKATARKTSSSGWRTTRPSSFGSPFAKKLRNDSSDSQQDESKRFILSKFLGLQQQQNHNGIMTTNSNEEFDISIYSKVSDLARLFIIQDQRRRKLLGHKPPFLEDQQWNENEHQLALDELPLDLKYAIIDFIPTYSRRSLFRHSSLALQKNLAASGIESLEEVFYHPFNPLDPKELDKKRVHECLFEQDTPFMTYHKMRLINREYSIRMKINILKTTHIDMSSTHDKTSFLFYLTFMRAQRLYAEGLLDMNHPFIYQDRKTISDLLSQQHPNVALPQMFDDPVKLNDDTTSNSNTSEEIIEEQLIPSWDALTNQESLSDEFLSSTIQKMATETINKSLAKTKKVKKTPLRANYDASAKTNNENSTETVYNYIIPFELFTLSTFPEADRNRALGSDQLIEYIGKNTLLESLSLCQLRDDQLLVVFSCCPNLTKMRAIDWDSFHMDRMPALSKLETIEIFNCYSDSFFESHEFLDNIRTSSPLTNIILSLSDLSETDASTVSMWRGASIFYGKKQIQTRSNDCKITVNINHISDTDYIYEIIEALTQLAYFKRDGLSFHRLVQRLCRENILCVKQLMDTLFRDFMIPLECIGGKHRLPAVLFEYAVYLANTYQNGRFLSSQAGMDELKSALEAGLQIGSCLEEVLFQLTPALIEPALTYLNTIYSPKKMECLVRCLFLHTLHFRSDPDFFLPVLAFIAHNNIDTSLIFSPIRCALPRYESQRIRFITNSEMKYISIPSAALVMQSSFQCASLYLDLISPDQLLYQNELGDTFLHIPLVFEEQLTLEIALQKQPKLAHILNKESRSVMHILARSYTNTPILYRLITRYHADIFHKDMYGQTPFDDDNEVVLDMSNNNVVLLTIRDAKGYFAFK